ncbi:uncharacterized protein SPAPADRAFT_143967 [Spathaspora passalidarum NRRL Y-27907]|uniref:Transcriptional protein SWT1 n=1 Tax=Spathaspora passalidarum (strain NRRL Y-27907 / 11-Y1) TaxID=619300 RepID=G3AV22_SPAPN|nr:uncharacterized protein SPAPADRAFT_143967 [Spathaspora passalidarum NRRL Y-27907]EGW30096.1 hypothetical protein SPAPADRAFT_143967 [Spathaspora passalidarum NRRL Y-27907]
MSSSSSSLPSRYAPEGLSEEDQHRVITSGHARRSKPIEYTIKTIESKIHDALTNQTYQNNTVDGDIEMVPMDDAEVDVISSYVSYSRDSGNLQVNSGDEMYDDIMMVEKPEETHANGNLSMLVVDTNFILSHLKVVDELKGLAREFGLRIVIPVMVMRELDGLKNSSRLVDDDSPERLSGVSVGHLARWANDWIYNSLANNSSVVIGQKLGQRLDKNAIQDDAILDCCLYFKQRANLVVLLSNDKNLCNKALTNDVLTVTFKTGMSAKLIAKVIYDENVNQFGKLAPMEIEHVPSLKHKHKEASAEPSREWVQSTQEVQAFRSFAEVAEKVYSEIQMILLSAIHHCMEVEYGEDLDLLRDYTKESIVTIQDCSQVLIRFWFTVFDQYFRASPAKFVPFQETGTGRKSVKHPLYVDIPTTPAELVEFIEFWTTALQIIYDGVMDETQQMALEHLIKRWHKMADL